MTGKWGVNRGHLTKCSVKYTNLPTASIVSWLLNCAVLVIKNIATNLKISLKTILFHFFPMVSIINSASHVNMVIFCNVLVFQREICPAVLQVQKIVPI